MTPRAAPLLQAVRLTPGRVHLQGLHPDGSPYALSLPRPVTFARLPQLLQPDRLTVYTLPPLAPLTLAYEVEPYTREGAALLQALGWGGPFPVPEGAQLGGHPHGAEVPLDRALFLLTLPAAADWAMLPAAPGRVCLRWADACTAAELSTSTAFFDCLTAALEGAALPPVTA